MLSYTPPHQRGFGTQSRFMRAEVGRAAALPPATEARCEKAATAYAFVATDCFRLAEEEAPAPMSG